MRGIIIGIVGLIAFACVADHIRSDKIGIAGFVWFLVWFTYGVLTFHLPPL